MEYFDKKTGIHIVENYITIPGKVIPDYQVVKNPNGDVIFGQVYPYGSVFSKIRLPLGLLERFRNE